MKKITSIALGLLSGYCALAQGTSFTYQGHLNVNGQPANGAYNLTFALFDSNSIGNQVGVTLTNSATAVSNGLFTVALDYGNGFTGASRWLQIGVQSNTVFVPLVPRQQITPTPYAIFAENVGMGGLAAGTYGNAMTFTNAANSFNGSFGGNFGGNFGGSFSGNFTGNFSGNGGGLTNVIGTFVSQVVPGTNVQAASNTGYLATNNNALVTVTLPISMNIGDIVRVSGIGAGGWKIAQNANQFVSTKYLDGNIGTLWTPRDSNRNWMPVASSADGTKLVAAENLGQIYTSTDSGVTWTARDSNRGWISVASSADGTKLVAVTDQIYTSTDSGVTWTPQNSGSRSWNSVASSADGTKFVAVVDGGQIYTSTDSGMTWTPRDSSRTWWSVASSADGTKLVAVEYGGRIYTSTDSGVTWTPRDSIRNWSSVASSSDGTKLVAVYEGAQIYTSTDSGVTWTAQNSGSRQWFSVASSADGNKLVAVENGGQIYISPNSGVAWTARESIRNWQSVASSADGTKLVAVEIGGQIYTSVPSSVASTTTGTAGYLQGDQNAAIELEYFGNGQFLPISFVGLIQAF